MSASFGYITSPWKILSNSLFYTSNTSASVAGSATTIPGTDLANVTPQCGVYLINGSSSLGGTEPPIAIPTSMANLGMADAWKIDDGFILYPGFGIQAFQGLNYTGTESLVTYNTTNEPLFLASNNTAYPSYANMLLKSTNPVTLYSTAANVTQSIKVFYKGKQLTSGVFT